MKRIQISICLLALLLWQQGGLAESALPEPGASLYVLDAADVLSPQTEAWLDTVGAELDRLCGAQFAVVAVRSTGGEPIDAYALALANAWALGDAEKNNGFLLLLAIDDDDYYALPGLGIMDAFPGSEIRGLLMTCLEPEFVTKDYDEGVRRIAPEIARKLASIYGCEAAMEPLLAAPAAVPAAEAGVPAAQSPGGTSAAARGFSLLTALLTLFALLIG